MIKTNADITNAYWRLANLSIQKEDYLLAKTYLEKMMEYMKGDVGVIKRKLEFVNQKLNEN